MYIVLYRWKIKTGMEEKFRSAWRTRTQQIIVEEGGLGSRLHQATDGSWIAYAQWPDRERWSKFWNAPKAQGETGQAMRSCIESSDEPTGMSVIDDLLVQGR